MPTDTQIPPLLSPAHETRLRERLPDVYDRVYEAFKLRGDTEVRDAV